MHPKKKVIFNKKKKINYSKLNNGFYCQGIFLTYERMSDNTEDRCKYIYLKKLEVRKRLI